MKFCEMEKASGYKTGIYIENSSTNLVKYMQKE